jgi:hypothetical protein
MEPIDPLVKDDPYNSLIYADEELHNELVNGDIVKYLEMVHEKRLKQFNNSKKLKIEIEEIVKDRKFIENRQSIQDRQSIQNIKLENTQLIENTIDNTNTLNNKQKLINDIFNSINRLEETLHKFAPKCK